MQKYNSPKKKSKLEAFFFLNLEAFRRQTAVLHFDIALIRLILIVSV